MKSNLYIVRHGKVNRDINNRNEYLHLDKDGLDFSEQLNKRFGQTYFDHILYQSVDLKNRDPYNNCLHTVKGLKGIKSEFDKTQVKHSLEALTVEGSDVQNMVLCLRSDAFHVISNILSPASSEEFNMEYHRVFHYRFDGSNFRFIEKFGAELV